VSHGPERAESGVVTAWLPLVFAVWGFASFAAGCLFMLWLVKRQARQARGGHVVVGPWRRP
ncbi:MAG: hypothetical protein ACRDNC_14695, partial [Gaiellaceae bacterium]